MPSVDPVSSAIQVAASAAQTVAGIVNAKKTKNIAKDLERSRPRYKISQLAQDDLDLAESEAANGGLSSRAESAYNNLNNQQFASSLEAILKGGGSVNNIGSVFGANEEGRQRLALLNDQMRLAKIKNLMGARETMRGEQDKEWQVNDWAPWRDKQKANSEARAAAQNQIWSGIGNVASAGMNYFGAKADQKQWDSYFGQPGGSGNQPTPGLSNASNFNFNPNQGRMNGIGRAVGSTNFNPTPDPYDNFEMPDYLSDQNWLQGSHNMF